VAILRAGSTLCVRGRRVGLLRAAIEVVDLERRRVAARVGLARQVAGEVVAEAENRIGLASEARMVAPCAGAAATDAIFSISVRATRAIALCRFLRGTKGPS
jgi:hypothetical protein